MKLVVAIVRPEKLGDVLESLFRAEVRGLTLHRVQGHGGETEQVETYRGTTVKMELSDKVRLSRLLTNLLTEPKVVELPGISAGLWYMTPGYELTALAELIKRP